jgi:hypothetical protein
VYEGRRITWFVDGVEWREAEVIVRGHAGYDPVNVGDEFSELVADDGSRFEKIRLHVLKVEPGALHLRYERPLCERSSELAIGDHRNSRRVIGVPGRW